VIALAAGQLFVIVFKMLYNWSWHRPGALYTGVNGYFLPNLAQKVTIMAGGWTRDGGVQEQIDASVADAIKLARSRLSEGRSLTHCEACEEEIPQARRKAIPGVRLCVRCQEELEKHQTTPTGFNRRGSKDSQLR
jgi:phage/conjugal plasmid C-4 type zinc finger TraR family protein